MAKYLRRKKLPVLFWIPLILVSAVLFFLLTNSGRQPVREEYTLTLPEGFVLQTDDKTRNALILRGEDTAGGVLHCPFGSSEPPTLYPINHQAPKPSS